MPLRGAIRAAGAVLAIVILAGAGLLHATPAANGEEGLGPGQPHRVFDLNCVIGRCGRSTLEGDVVGNITIWPGYDVNHPQWPGTWTGETQHKVNGPWSITDPNAFWSLWLRTESHPEAVRPVIFNMPLNSPQKAYESVVNTLNLGYAEAEMFSEQLIVEIAYDIDDGDVGQGLVVARGTSPAP